jgi:hypothetical protein
MGEHLLSVALYIALSDVRVLYCMTIKKTSNFIDMWAQKCVKFAHSVVFDGGDGVSEKGRYL